MRGEKPLSHANLHADIIGEFGRSLIIGKAYAPPNDEGRYLVRGSDQ